MMEIKTTSKFRKDLKQAKKKGLNMALLQKVVDDFGDGEKARRTTPRPRPSRRMGYVPRMPYSTGLAVDLQDFGRCAHIDTDANRFTQRFVQEIGRRRRRCLRHYPVVEGSANTHFRVLKRLFWRF